MSEGKTEEKKTVRTLSFPKTLAVLTVAVAAGAALLALDFEKAETGVPALEQADAATKADVLASAEFGRPGDIVLGEADAPVTIIEYASTTCGHCARFKLETFPALKEKYIDTGLVKYTLREFPTADPVLAASAFMLARCVSEDRYYNLIDVIFRTQRQWAYVRSREQGREELQKIAKQAGISADAFQKCLSNEAEYQRIKAVQEEGVEVFNVSATPTFIINGKNHSGYMPFEKFEEALAEHLPEDAKP